MGKGVVGVKKILDFYPKRNGKPLKDSEWYDRPGFCCPIVSYGNIIIITFKSVLKTIKPIL